ncbi:ribonuclease H-like domain-containing protein, partial [Mycena sp. CBHHK59/15]
IEMGYFTMDNASNNATFMQHLSLLLASKGILNFDPKENYIFCFTHIINLCSQAVIKAMEKEDSRVVYSDTDTETEPGGTRSSICCDGFDICKGSVSQDWNNLEILELILQQPHTVQTIMSSENTPILAGTIPAFELFMSSWQAMLDDPVLEDESIAQIVQPGLNVAEKYYNKFGDTDAYIISMFINPSIRFEWIRKNWSYEDQKRARKSLPCIVCPMGVIAAMEAWWSRSGLVWGFRFSIFKTAGFTLRAKFSRRVWGVEDEMTSYIQSPIPSPQTTDMIGHWMNHGITTWPTIYCMFVDYALIQATSVPSEWVFSSSAETDMKRRNQTSPYLMEALQMLKFNYKKSQLNFMADWQSAPIEDEDEDWLRHLASVDEPDHQEAMQVLTEVFETADFVPGCIPEDEMSM